MRNFVFLLIISFATLVATSSISTKLEDIVVLTEDVVEEIDIDFSALSKVFDDDYAYLLKNSKRINFKTNNNCILSLILAANDSELPEKEKQAHVLFGAFHLPTLEEIVFLHLFYLF